MNIIPEKTTILSFRHLLEKHNLGAQIIETVEEQVKAHGMAIAF